MHVLERLHWRKRDRNHCNNYNVDYDFKTTLHHFSESISQSSLF